ncbi:hypothetical protein RUND412_008387 [Rhizina undulata]
MEDRKQPRKKHLVGFVPFGGTFQDAAKPILIELKQLPHGKLTWQKLTILQDAADRLLYFHVVRDEERIRSQARHADNHQDAEKLLRDHGLHSNTSPLSLIGPSINYYIQIALDIAHALQKGNGERTIQATFDFLFNDHGKQNFTSLHREYVWPPGFSRQPNPVVNSRSFSMKNISTFISAAPFIFTAMNPHDGIFQRGVIEKYQTYYGDSFGYVELLKLIVNVYVSLAQAHIQAFSKVYVKEDYPMLARLLGNAPEL